MSPRIALAWLTGLAAYMLAMVMSSYDGVLSLIFQPMVGAIVSGIGVLLTAIPTSLVRRMQLKQGSMSVAIIATAVGFGLICLSNSDRFVRYERDTLTHEPYRVLHLGLLLPGFLFAIAGPLLLPGNETPAEASQ